MNPVGAMKLTDIKRIRCLARAAYFLNNLRDKKGYIESGNSIKNKGIKLATRFKIGGKNNIINIDKSALIKNSEIVITGNDCIVHIQEGAIVSGAIFWIEDNGCRLEIGRNTFIGPSHLAVTENGSILKIGDDCMVSSNVTIRTGDSHSILDVESNQRINHAQNISVDNHCWIGEGTKILKGVHLAEHCVVSTGAIVTKSFPANCLIGGVPAKILRENITWNRARL
jgi:acetyltransferase-like isoleucine patch superfamily enzyme